MFKIRVTTRSVFLSPHFKTKYYNLKHNYVRNFSDTSNEKSTVQYGNDFSKSYTEFMSFLPAVTKEFSNSLAELTTPKIAHQFEECIYHMSERGRKFRGLGIIKAFKELAQPELNTKDNLKLAHYLGWYMEFLNSLLLIIDDILDNSEMRRGKPCWHRRKDVGLNAINHSFIFKQTVLEFLKKNFEHLPTYNLIVDRYNEYVYYSTVGQLYDNALSSINVTEFTTAEYDKMAQLKTAYAITYSPLAIGAIFAGHTDMKIWEKMKPILLDLGTFYQYQNDFEDCFGELSSSGKVSSDIQENKCTWLAAQAVERGSKEQREAMRKCYGKHDPDCVQTVRQIYLDLQLPEFYYNYKDEILKVSDIKLGVFKEKLPKKIFSIIKNDFFGRI